MEKYGKYNVIIPNMKLYRKAKIIDKKQKGDLFNVGKWNLNKDKFVYSSMPNGNQISAWCGYYLVLKKRI